MLKHRTLVILHLREKHFTTMAEFKIENEDLYEILGIEITATAVEIKKAYRKKALECHPDKNPDNPNAGKLFHELTKILEVLTDEAARKAYDKVLKGKKEAAIRHKELDGKRRKLKEDLEAREKHATFKSSTVSKTADQQLKEEIERLRKEGSKQVEEEMEYVLNKLKEDMKFNSNQSECNKCRIKIKWKAKKSDTTNGGYNEELLRRFLSKYGDISELVISQKKNGSALVEYNSQRAAEMAVELEKGLAENMLEMQWVNGPPSSSSSRIQSATIKPSDYESIVFTKLRQAEERKRLIEQMMAEENENS